MDDLVEIQPGLVLLHRAGEFARPAGDDVAGQAAVHHIYFAVFIQVFAGIQLAVAVHILGCRIQSRVRRAVAGQAGDKEGIAGILERGDGPFLGHVGDVVAVGVNLAGVHQPVAVEVVGHHAGFGVRHGGHGIGGHGHQGRDGRASDDLAIGQSPRPGYRRAVDGLVQHCPPFKGVVGAPHFPHALGKVGVKVAVEDGISDSFVAVARAAISDLVGVGGAWPDGLAIQVVGLRVVGGPQPLVGVQVENVVFFRPGVQVAEDDPVVHVAVVDVGGVIREKDFAGFGAGVGQTVAVEVGIGRDVNHLSRVAHGPGGQEELFVFALGAVPHRPHAQAVGDNF